MAALYYTLYGVAAAVFGGWCFVWLLHITGLCLAKYYLHRKINQLPPETPVPGISIIKPLVGIDPNLFSNLETFFTMRYPKYELLFCISDESDSSIMLVKRLIEKYPAVDSCIFVGGENVGLNPKINNMMPGYRAAKYELVMVSDSRIRMKEDTLLDMVSYMTGNVALVHQMPFTCDRIGFPATLEKVFFGTYHARMYLIANMVGINCATGMSVIMKKEVLDEAGGFEVFGKYLAEDYFFAQYMLDNGFKLSVCSQPALQNSGVCEVADFQSRITRWAKLRISMVPFTALFEPFSECMLMGLAASWAANFIFNWDPITLYLVHTLVWFFLDWILVSIVQNGILPFSKFEYVVSWLFREICTFFLFMKAIFDPTIRWRIGTFRLRWGGIVEEVKPKS
ncbi:Ceramide glucosyltransferase [Nymphon striatum]|nr:Ceramide glucosyltransferase [Nymphon striatum]